MKFKFVYAISLIFFVLKLIVGCFGLIKPEFIASKVVEVAGVTSIMNSRTVTLGMSKYVITVMVVLLSSSILGFMGIEFMRRKKQFGFYIYALVQIIVAALLMYSGFNIYAGLQYLSIIPLLGILLYVWNWEHFSASN